MKNLLILLIFVCASASAQTTFILVRHAEKESGAADPMLSKEGEARAQSLVRLLDKQKVDAIYSTNFNRTKNTVKPLADAKGISVQIYEKDPDVGKMSGTVVICGHSNTIPALANKLLGKEQFKTFEDSDYGNILIIHEGSVTLLRY
jgi:2,3-bisphosphoglycerate-dependent phosphoglycerate mutase